jgi:hypothetical protein
LFPKKSLFLIITKNPGKRKGFAGVFIFYTIYNCIALKKFPLLRVSFFQNRTEPTTFLLCRSDLKPYSPGKPRNPAPYNSPASHASFPFFAKRREKSVCRSGFLLGIPCNRNAFYAIV